MTVQVVKELRLTIDSLPSLTGGSASLYRDLKKSIPPSYISKRGADGRVKLRGKVKSYLLEFRLFRSEEVALL